MNGPFGGFFGQGAFQLDPNSTPEMLDRKRAMIAAMVPRFGKANYVGEGIGQLATGIMAGVKGRQLDKFEGGKRAEATEAFNGALGGGPMSILGMPPQASGVPSGAPTVGGFVEQPSAPQGDMASRIQQGLEQRGLPPHIAQGFVMNMQDESCLLYTSPSPRD